MHLANEIFLWSAGLYHDQIRGNASTRINQKYRKIKPGWKVVNVIGWLFQLKVSFLSKGCFNFFSIFIKQTIFLLKCSKGQIYFLLPTNNV